MINAGIECEIIISAYYFYGLCVICASKSEIFITLCL